MKDSDNLARLLRVISLITFRFRTREEIINELSGMGYDIPDRTFDRILANIKDLGYKVINQRNFGYKIEDKVIENPDLNLTLTLNTLVLSKQRLQNLSRNDIISQTTQSDGIEYIPIILDAIQSSMTLSFTHYSFKAQKDTNYEVIPVNLLETQNRWYLVALVENKYIQTFGLDRVKNVNQNVQFTQMELTEENKQEIDKYSYMVGVAPPIPELPNEIMDITIAVKESLLPYLKTKLIHNSQKITQSKKEEYTLVELRLVPNLDLIKTIARELGHIKIVSPESLVNYISKRYPELASIILF